MSTKQRTKKITDEPEREYFVVPSSWARMGSHTDVDDDERRYYAEAVCVESQLVGEPVGPNKIDYSEDVRMWVRYRCPATDDLVEQSYRAAAIDTGDGMVYEPKVVRRGGPDKFDASIAVPVTEVED